MKYDPFSRGPHAVGVRTADLSDSSRNRYLPVEVWYPATSAYAGKDTAPETMDHYELLPGFPPGKQSAVRGAEMDSGRFPIVLFSHGFGGHRRQSTFLCTHLASHGYVVAAMDHTGNTIIDMAQMTLQVMMGEPMPEPGPMIAELIETRPRDVNFVLDRLLNGDTGIAAASLDAERVGMSGHSFGGWTTLMATARDRRIRAALALAPAGGKTHMPAEALIAALDFAWGRDVPTMYLVADKDSILPLEGMHELYDKTPGTKRMAVLLNSDHMHFCDDVEQIHDIFRAMPPPGPFEAIAKNMAPASAYCPGAHAYDFTRGLGLAHMDASLRKSEQAAAFLASDIPAVFRERGISVSVV